MTPGNIADITMAFPMLEAFAPAKRLIADKAYDADRLRAWLHDKGIEAVIPGRAARAVVYRLNRTAYRRRNIVERMFGGSRIGSASRRDTTGLRSTISPPLSSLRRSPNGLDESPT